MVIRLVRLLAVFKPGVLGVFQSYTCEALSTPLPLEFEGWKYVTSKRRFPVLVSVCSRGVGDRLFVHRTGSSGLATPSCLFCMSRST